MDKIKKKALKKTFIASLVDASSILIKSIPIPMIPDALKFIKNFAYKFLEEVSDLKEKEKMEGAIEEISAHLKRLEDEKKFMLSDLESISESIEKLDDLMNKKINESLQIICSNRTSEILNVNYLEAVLDKELTDGQVDNLLSSINQLIEKDSNVLADFDNLFIYDKRRIEISLLRIFNIKEMNDFLVELDNIIKSVFNSNVFIQNVESYYCDLM